ncbi:MULTISPECIES: CaiB/BaiF CoA transferase family protein [Burkholderia]|uniref:CaiB/BaiF CoA transferase family protein n=1 Tax=Burkholderia TaxID=32008 RepID=UPI00158F0743|nr:CoA transferase [Burkholderia seminalis]
MTRQGALHGIRVLDMTRVIAGPYAAQILGDLGAEVVKVERPGEGDDVRHVGPPWMKDEDGHDTETSTYYQTANRNKRSITIDFHQPEGRQLIRDMAAQADVLIENYRTGTLARQGLGYEELKALNPRLIYCSVTGFGQTGPYAGRSGYDYIAQAMAGLMSVTGARDGQPGAGPTRVGVPVADASAGLYATIGVLAALHHRDTHGVGQYIDISLLDAQLSIMLNAFSAWFNAGVELGRTGNDHPSAAPYGLYEASDGLLLIATFNDREFARLARLVGRPEWTEDSRFARNRERVAHRAELAAALGDVLRQRTRAEWDELLNAGQVSCGPVNAMPDLARDRHVIARELVVELQHPVHGRSASAASPMRLSESPVSYRLAPPAMGEHTSEVLREWLQLDDDVIAALRRKQVV